MADGVIKQIQALRTMSVAELRQEWDRLYGEPDRGQIDTKRKPCRDLRLPSPGTVLTRQYHGQEIRVLTLDDGFEWQGTHFGSLSALARAVTGQRWNGLLFFGLTKRKRR